MFQNVAILGPGLIGGSLGMALRSRGLARRVVGVGRRRESLERALQVGAIDEATLDPCEGAEEADFVVLATPIGAMQELVSRVAPALRANALLTDVASAKVRVVDAVCSALRERPDVAYVPSHPMAGGEQTGAQAASAGLFEGAVCILTPVAGTGPEANERVRSMWGAVGARVVTMSPQAHDRVVARISHLPHVVAAALVWMLDDQDAALCGRGLLDTTRVASGSPEMWLDICAANAGELARALADYTAALNSVGEALSRGDLGQLKHLLETAKRRRDALAARREAVGPHAPQTP